MSNELCYLSATKAGELFTSKKLSPVELLQALINRAEQVEPSINAFSFEYFDEAMDAARLAEKSYMKGSARPLEGIAVAVKDEENIIGKVTTNGSLLLQDNVAQTHSPVVERMLNAGAIIHARTTTPEFSSNTVTHSRLWGVTRNPWNTEYTPGGSSGGAGASLAAGTTTLANGSDIAGSIRVPASCSGVIGFKPPYGRVPDESPYNLDTYAHQGPMARTVADCRLFQNVLSGPHPFDPASVSPKLTIPDNLENIRGMRIGYSLDLGYFSVDSEVRENTLAAVEVFRHLGATVEEVDIGWNSSCLTTAMTHLHALFGSTLQRDCVGREEQLTDYVRYFLGTGSSPQPKSVVEANLHAGEMFAQLSKVFASYDLLICPTVATTFVKADFDYSKDTLIVDGEIMAPSLASWCMTYPFNTLSRCPVLSVPTGFASNDVPTGMQIVGPSFDDVTVFKAAMAYESAKPPMYSGGLAPEILQQPELVM
ncbi:amidase [Halioxenophilus aromaticivorans]|uniref:Amidase n=1 Tax=Halioxenophilus aromaticivorans TaxID=1306992 RepID=A0AAV3U7Q9_9ALTE